jgi:hypothetical protein
MALSFGASDLDNTIQAIISIETFFNQLLMGSTTTEFENSLMKAMRPYMHSRNMMLLANQQ